MAPIGLGAKLRSKGYFASLLHPQEEKLGYYFQSGTCLGALKKTQEQKKWLLFVVRDMSLGLRNYQYIIIMCACGC